MSEGADRGARGGDGGGRSLDVDVGDIANIYMRREDVERGDVEILEDKFDFGVLVLGSERKMRNGFMSSLVEHVPRDRQVAHLAQSLGQVDLEEILPEPGRLLHRGLKRALRILRLTTDLLSDLLHSFLDPAREILLSVADVGQVTIVTDTLLDRVPLLLEIFDAPLPLLILLRECSPPHAELLAIAGGSIASHILAVG